MQELTSRGNFALNQCAVASLFQLRHGLNKRRRPFTRNLREQSNAKRAVEIEHGDSLVAKGDCHQPGAHRMASGRIEFRQYAFSHLQEFGENRRQSWLLGEFEQRRYDFIELFIREMVEYAQEIFGQ